MEKMLISKASKQFEISTTRIYVLIHKGIVVGEIAPKRGKLLSWVSPKSLKEHIKNRPQKMKLRKKAKSTKNTITTYDAAKELNLSFSHVCRLVREGALTSNKKFGVNYIDRSSVEDYKKRKYHKRG